MKPRSDRNKKHITAAGKPMWSDEQGCTVVRVYVILTADGSVKRVNRSYAAGLYINEKRAIRSANNDGDSVIALDIPLSKAPVFIRKKMV